MPWRMDCIGGLADHLTRSMHHIINQIDYLAEIIPPHHHENEQVLCRLVVDGVDSQA